MPVMGGIQLGKALRKVDASLPMIAICGFGGFDPQEALEPSKGGFETFPRKPFTESEFQHASLAAATMRNSIAF
jgi:FixJ family two-component response regulator